MQCHYVSNYKYNQNNETDMKTAYYIEYINDDLANCYYQLVRASDRAILRASKSLDRLQGFCDGANITNYCIL